MSQKKIYRGKQAESISGKEIGRAISVQFYRYAVFAFRNMMTAPIRNKARMLLIGTVLASGNRTVASALRATGLSQEAGFATYHHVLSRARWSCFRAARILLIDTFAPSGLLIFGGDETLERRRGEQLSKLGIYRDAVAPARASSSNPMACAGTD